MDRVGSHSFELIFEFVIFRAVDFTLKFVISINFIFKIYTFNDH
jgi:hypothetical protein